MNNRKDKYKIVGWREWVALPELEIPKIKAKVDTGARSSSLHALDINCIKENKNEYVEFVVHSRKKNKKEPIQCRCRVLEHRKIKSSNGQTELRPVIQTTIEFMGDRWPIELNLTNRDEMGIQMLLGRESIRDKFLVDPHRSFYGKNRA